MRGPPLKDQVALILGAQWGDEGKGKWIDMLAPSCDMVVRFQGGDNAGHTLFIEGKKHVLHLLPSGIFQKDMTCVLAAGMVINPNRLLAELSELKPVQDVGPGKLWISARSQIITPWHIHLDKLKEKEQAIGTTKRGIGPTYTDKVARSGLRMSHFIHESKRQAWVESMKTQPGFAENLEEQAEEWQTFHEAARLVAPFVRDTEHEVRKAIAAGRSVLFEGAQGSLLDIDHGTYPYVTSSSTIAGGAITSIGMAPKAIQRVIGVTKAYATRVGAGPFPTEEDGPIGQELARKGKEFGATTKRPRRCGWLDLVALKYAVEVNGCDELILNKLDILSEFDEIKVATAYQHPTLGKIEQFPSDGDTLQECKPVYATLSGWDEDLSQITDKNQLPEAVWVYVRFIEEFVQCPVSMLGNGPERGHAIPLIEESTPQPIAQSLREKAQRGAIRGSESASSAP